VAGKQAFDKKVAEIQSLAEKGKSAETVDALRRALKDRSNYVVSKAAEIAGRLACSELIPDIAAAFDRFLPDAAKADPQCWAKNAIAKTLVGFEHPESDLYLRGLRHIQLEPVFGGYQDTAATLRGTCAHALILCRDLSDLTILRHLVDLLADSEPTARIEAARAISQLGRPEGALVLRTKIYCGDSREDVVGHTMAALLALEPKESIAVVAKFLDHSNEDLRFEAAAALGECREPEAFELLRSQHSKARDPRWRRALLVSIGASLQQAAIDFLVGLITSENMRDAADAIAALEPFRFREEQKARIEAAVRQAGSDVLLQTFRKTFRV
jgi:HEAT repeat protein